MVFDPNNTPPDPVEPFNLSQELGKLEAMNAAEGSALGDMARGFQRILSGLINEIARLEERIENNDRPWGDLHQDPITEIIFDHDFFEYEQLDGKISVSLDEDEIRRQLAVPPTGGLTNAGGTVEYEEFIDLSCFIDPTDVDCLVFFKTFITVQLALETDHQVDPAYTLVKNILAARTEIMDDCKVLRCIAGGSSPDSDSGVVESGSEPTSAEYDRFRPCGYTSTDLDIYMDSAIFDSAPVTFTDPVFIPNAADCCWEFVDSGHTNVEPIVVGDVTIVDGCADDGCGDALPDPCPVAYESGNGLNWKLTALSLTKIKAFYAQLQSLNGACGDFSGTQLTEWDGTLSDTSQADCQWDLEANDTTYFIPTLNGGKADIDGDNSGVALVGALPPDFWNVQLAIRTSGVSGHQLIWKKPCGGLVPGKYKLNRGALPNSLTVACGADFALIDFIEVEAA